MQRMSGPTSVAAAIPGTTPTADAALHVPLTMARAL